MKFRVLGPLEILGEDGPIAVTSPAERSVLLQLLLSANQTVSSNRLSDDLWDGSPPDSARKTLKVYVSRLRKALGGLEGVLQTRDAGYVLRVADDDIDANAFERDVAEARAELAAGDPERAASLLVEALAMWRGPALVDVADRPFARAEAERLEETRLAAIEDRVEADLRAGRHHEVAGELATLTTAHPLRERLWSQRILALYRSGQQADALRAYQELRSVLNEELGLDPSPQLQDLEQRVLRQDENLEWQAPIMSSVFPTLALAFPESLVVRGPFVGRETQMDQLIDVYQDVKQGHRRAVLIAGEPGIGKTRLAAELARQANNDGALVLFGRCDEDLRVPYQPFVEALRAVVATCPDDELRAHVKRHGGDLARLMPDLTRRLPKAPAPTAADPETERYRMFEAVAGLLADCSRSSPVALVLDDLHWAAKPTVLLLRHLLRASPLMPLLVIGTYRDTELDRAHPLAEVLADLRGEPTCQRLLLRGLDRDGVSAYLQAASGQALHPSESELVSALHTQTEGNPFFVTEVMRHLVEGGDLRRESGRWVVADGAAPETALPEGVREVVARRLARLTQTANDALAIASVVGQNFAFALVERVMGADDDSVVVAIEEAQRAGLVTERSGGYSFTHTLIRNTLYDELSSTRRARLHRRVGELIEASPDAIAHAEALAHHFAEAAIDGEAAKAADYALAAGRRALDRLSYEEAVTILRRGISALDVALAPESDRQAALLLALADACRAAGQSDEARAQALLAADVARASGSAKHLAEITIFLTRWSAFGVADTEVADLCSEALAGLDDAEVGMRAQVTAGLARYQAWGMAGWGGASALAAEALALARQTGDPAVLLAVLVNTSYALMGSDLVDERRSLLNELIALAQSVNDHASFGDGLAMRSVLRLQCGDRDGFELDAEGLRALADKTGSRHPRARAVCLRITGALLDGRYVEVEPLTAEMMAIGGQDLSVANWQVGQLAVAVWDRGQREEIDQLAEAVTKFFPDFVALRTYFPVLHASRGEFDVAHQQLADLTESDLVKLPRDVMWGVAIANLAEATGLLGDTTRAALLYGHLLPYGGQLILFGHVAAFGAADTYLGILNATLERWDDAEARYLAALELGQRVGSLPALARTKLWYAKMLVARDNDGDAVRAVALLTESLAIAEELGMAGVVTAARELLGADVRPRHP